MRMRAQMLRCALRAVVTLVAQKGGNVLRAPCSLLRVRDGRVQSCASWSNFSGLWQAGGKGFGSVPLRFCASQTPVYARLLALTVVAVGPLDRGNCLTDC